MNNDQKALASLVAKRNAAAADLERFRKSARELGQAEQVATKATAEASLQLEAATMAKVKGEANNTANARAVYQTALADLACAETESRAAARVVSEAEASLDTLTKQAAHQAVEVCKAIAQHGEQALLDSAKAFGKQLARRRAITRAARAASAATGLNSDPVSELHQACPLKLKLDDLIEGKELDAIGYSEQDLLAARIGDA